MAAVLGMVSVRIPTFFSSSTYSPPISMTSTLPARHGGERELDVVGGKLRSVVEADPFAQVKPPRPSPVQDLPPFRQHGDEVALGVSTQQVFPQGLEHDVLGSDIQIGQPSLVAE